MFLAWRYGQEDPWRLYNCLGADFRPVWDSELPPMRPRHPDRLQRWMYAMGKAAAIIEGKMEDSKFQAPKREAPSRVVLPPGIEDPRAGR